MEQIGGLFPMIDLIVFGVILFGFIRGFLSGLVKEVASLSALILSVIFCYFFYQKVSEILLTIFALDLRVSYGIAILLIFVFTFFTFTIVAKIITKIINYIGMGMLNKLLGGFFCGIKYLLIISLLLFIAELLVPKSVLENLLQDSNIYPSINWLKSCLENWFLN